ncbi:MAG: DUF2384 domain-containing protein [Armatimonadetes bacterium]|nr:DUF2384 domain-containing protein [Armatimonadota bacterium]
MYPTTQPNLTAVMVADDVELLRGLEQHCGSVSFYFRPPSLVNDNWAESLGAVDLVVWDWSQLPGAEPRRVLRELQTRRPDLPMFVLNLNLGDEGVDDLIQGGATDFARRPADVEEVSHRIHRLLALRRPGSRPTPTDPDTAGRNGYTSPVRVFSPVAFELHNPQNGRLDAKRISTLFGIPLRQLATALGQKPQTVAKTPDSRGLQPGLLLFARIATALYYLLGTEEALRIWINLANPHLGDETPMDLLLGGEGEAVLLLLNDNLIGQPA